jgi:hypothetical protein
MWAWNMMANAGKTDAAKPAKAKRKKR